MDQEEGMLRPIIVCLCSMLAVASGRAQASDTGKWVVNVERLSCNAACGELFPLSPGRNAEGNRYYVCAAQMEGDKSGLRPGYNVRGNPNSCELHDGNASASARDFSCYCVITPLGDQD